jgi:hypothetical protein
MFSFQIYNALYLTSIILIQAYLNNLYLSFYALTLINVSLFLSNSYLTGTSLSNYSLVYSYRFYMLKNLMLSNTYLRSLSLREDSNRVTKSSFLSKYLFFLDFSHQFFHALNFNILFSVLLSRAYYLKARNTLYLNHKLVTNSLIFSYLCSKSLFFEKASQVTNPCLNYLERFLVITQDIKSPYTYLN